MFVSPFLFLDWVCRCGVCGQNKEEKEKKKCKWTTWSDLNGERTLTDMVYSELKPPSLVLRREIGTVPTAANQRALNRKWEDTNLEVM